MALKGSRSAKGREKEQLAKAAAQSDEKSPHITEFPELVDVLPELCEEYRRQHSIAAAAETRKKELASEIKALMDAVEATGIRGDNWVAVRVPDGETNKLDPKLLLKAGVSYQTLNACTVTSPRAGYVQIKELENNG